MAKCSKCGKWKLFANWPAGLCPDCEAFEKDQLKKAAEVAAEKAAEASRAAFEKARTEGNDLQPSTQETAAASAKKPAAKKSGPKVYRVTGMSHHMDSLMRIAMEDDDYTMSKKELVDDERIGERIYRYFFSPIKAELVPEPDNPHDPNAIKVVVDGEHIGYIKAGSCAHLLKVIKGDRIKKISCEISGGPYKYIEEDYDYDKDKEVYTLEKNESPYSVVLSIDEQ